MAAGPVLGLQQCCGAGGMLQPWVRRLSMGQSWQLAVTGGLCSMGPVGECAALCFVLCCVVCAQVKQLAAYLTQREAEGEPAFSYTQATVTRWVGVASPWCELSYDWYAVSLPHMLCSLKT